MYVAKNIKANKIILSVWTGHFSQINLKEKRVLLIKSIVLKCTNLLASENTRLINKSTYLWIQWCVQWCCRFAFINCCCFHGPDGLSSSIVSSNQTLAVTHLCGATQYAPWIACCKVVCTLFTFPNVYMKVHEK